jgi:7-carboxy-7-deazaguanine synthase
MLVNEIFLALQGEAKESGMPTVFIRFTGCDLRCTYCDTKYAYGEGKEMSVGEILDKVYEVGGWTRRVCITGGEPLIQNEDDMIALMVKLKSNEFYISLETDGARDICLYSDRDLVDSIVMDWKTKSSAMTHKMSQDNLTWLRPQDQVKFIIGCEEDFTEAVAIIKEIEEYMQDEDELPIFLFSTVWQGFPLEKLVELILSSKIHNAKMQVQLHKLIYGPDKTGV